MELSIKIQNLEEAKAKLFLYPKISSPIFSKTINFALAEIVKNARDPQFQFKTQRSKRTGYLELSFNEKEGGKTFATPENLVGTVGPRASYAPYVYFGTSKGQRPNPYMDRILKVSEPKINELFKKAVELVTQKITKG